MGKWMKMRKNGSWNICLSAKTLSGSPFTRTGSSFARIPDLPALTNGTPHAAGAPTPLNLGVRLAEAGSVVTPRKRTLAQAEEGSPSIAGSAQEAVIASLQEQLARLERQQSLGVAEIMAGAIARQSELMEKVMTQKPPELRRGMIRIDPKAQWPILHDTDPDVEEFYDEYEGVCQLANDMRGLLPFERLVALKMCLRGSSLETYENVKTLTQEDGTYLSNPEAIYNTIKGTLLRFRRSYEEKQTLAMAERNGLGKGTLSAIQFEGKWERSIRKLVKFGLERSQQELMLAYDGKIHKQTAREIKKDRRAYANPDGTET